MHNIRKNADLCRLFNSVIVVNGFTSRFKYIYKKSPRFRMSFWVFLELLFVSI